jgi:malate synthase
MVPKAAMKNASWILSYEDWNVDTGLACGFSGKAQIGKGMWAMPDRMKQMVETKQEPPPGRSQLRLGALAHGRDPARHALPRGRRLRPPGRTQDRKRASLNDLLTLPLLDRALSAEEIQRELDNNCQGILGYVVRWIDQGIGCSKVPDITMWG